MLTFIVRVMVNHNILSYGSLQDNKRGCDFNELEYGPRALWPSDLDILLSLNSDDLPRRHYPHVLCQCGVRARKGVVPSELGYGYFCGNVVGENDNWVSDYRCFVFLITCTFKSICVNLVALIVLCSILEDTIGNRSMAVNSYCVKVTCKERT